MEGGLGTVGPDPVVGVEIQVPLAERGGVELVGIESGQGVLESEALELVGCDDARAVVAPERDVVRVVGRLDVRQLVAPEGVRVLTVQVRQRGALGVAVVEERVVEVEDDGLGGLQNGAG